MDISSSLSVIKGIGPKTTQLLNTAGLNTVRDVIYYFPKYHENFANCQSIGEIVPGNVIIKAYAKNVQTKFYRRGLRVTTANLTDGKASVAAVWFNQPYREVQLKEKAEFYFSGEFELSRGRYQLSNPRAEKVKDVDNSSESTMLPVYRQIKGIDSATLRRVIEKVRPYISSIEETLPSAIVHDYKLLNLASSLEHIHFPDNNDILEIAKHRLAFEELLSLLVASGLNKQEHSKLVGYNIPFELDVVKSCVDSLPYRLTDAQRRAIWQILKDFENNSPMNRLLQGDVGSGKTVVAGIAARQVASKGYQTVILAPTEILATQHHETLKSLLEPFGLNVALLTGKVKGSKRKAILSELYDGKIDVLVGTHAVLEDNIKFKKLGFVVIDEQHRFGVKQRQALLSKAKYMPHLLSMSATPIPRSLALTLYGELDISILDEKPVGRLPIITKIISPASTKQLFSTIDLEIEQGRQVYFICSLIDDNPSNDLKSVEAEYKKLKSTVFAHRKIGLLHGKMRPQEKIDTMNQFLNKEIDILVSTTVVEVGVNVPNATVMVIVDADRFGLSQLHQLRGRVGRSSLQSYCYLITSTTKKPSRRLQEIENSNDGFYLAEVDLEIRGPGEIYGSRQHGELQLQIASLADSKLIATVKRAANRIVSDEIDLLQYKEFNIQVEHYQRLTTLN